MIHQFTIGFMVESTVMYSRMRKGSNRLVNLLYVSIEVSNVSHPIKDVTIRNQ